MTEYTGFSGDETKQQGNYLALDFTASDGATTTVELLGGATGHPVDATDDMYCVFRITDKYKQKIKVVTTLGDDVVTKVYSLAGLDLETA